MPALPRVVPARSTGKSIRPAGSARSVPSAAPARAGTSYRQNAPAAYGPASRTRSQAGSTSGWRSSASSRSSVASPSIQRRAERPVGQVTKAEHRILFQTYFKSVGPRTYAAQIKQASNGNHFIVLTEGKRDASGQLKKCQLLVFSEDFPAFFRMLKETAEFVKANRVPEQVRVQRARVRQKQAPAAAPRQKTGRTPARV